MLLFNCLLFVVALQDFFNLLKFYLLYIEFISDVLLWTPTHGRAKAGRPAQKYIQQLCEDTGCSPEDLSGDER